MLAASHCQIKWIIIASVAYENVIYWFAEVMHPLAHRFQFWEKLSTVQPVTSYTNVKSSQHMSFICPSPAQFPTVPQVHCTPPGHNILKKKQLPCVNSLWIWESRKRKRKEYFDFLGGYNKRSKTGISKRWARERGVIHSSYLPWQLFPSNKHASMPNSKHY